MIYGIITRSKGVNKVIETNKRNEEYNKKAKQINLERESRSNQIAISYDNELAKINDLYQSTYNALQKYYDKGIIYSTYRNLSAVTAFIEYFESGRCDSFTGPYGAYNLY